MQFQTTLPSGVFTAVLTPLHGDLSVNNQALVAHCRWLLNNGSNGIALLGTTGEANSFTIEERMEIVDAVLMGGIPPDRLLVGTGCCAYTDAVRLTKHVLQYNIGGVLMLPPFYYKEVNDRGLAKFFNLIINELNDDRLRIYLYHFPKMSGIPFSLSLIRHLVKEYPGIVVGMKDSSGDWDNMQRVCRAIPGFKVYAGTEKYLLDILKIGGAGCISATANVTTRLAGALFNNWKEDDAEARQIQLSKLRNAFEGYPIIPVLKYLFAKWKGDESWLNLRPPNMMIGRKEAEIVEGKLNHLERELFSSLSELLFGG